MAIKKEQPDGLGRLFDQSFGQLGHGVSSGIDYTDLKQCIPTSETALHAALEPDAVMPLPRTRSRPLRTEPSLLLQRQRRQLFEIYAAREAATQMHHCGYPEHCRDPVHCLSSPTPASSPAILPLATPPSNIYDDMPPLDPVNPLD